ncbi:hypothetical protein DF146_14565 [Burkholderia cenocepacia]|uniref:hypothetical protein n=1 Tax=Burkholderia cenocepacia TaxID=95486 RepID=UPI000F5B7393|nr:hypothetical protein [Burkholderia cenocepacia]RQT96912.1 hypothetical protein DF165_10740 [Burkholderia cenocepacia]RQU53237.1 hypothetical protein DF146_14565 [Burkholderia cenocepacia]
MNSIITRSFGGLTRPYYIRNFLFSLIFPTVFIFISSFGKESLPGGLLALVLIFMAVSCLLYPYSRFVYESVVNYIVGRNMYFVNAALMLVVKFMTMFLCWYLAIFIAPLGLAYLFFRHRPTGAI